MTKIALFLLPLLLSLSYALKKNEQPHKITSSERPQISFTFDDGVTDDMPGYDFKTWNAMLLQHLEKEKWML